MGYLRGMETRALTPDQTKALLGLLAWTYAILVWVLPVPAPLVMLTVVPLFVWVNKVWNAQTRRQLASR